MVHVNSSIRWAIGAWCALALALVAWSVVVGARPSWTATLLIVCAAPLAVVATLVGFRTEPRTAAQVLHGRDRASR